MDLSIEDIKACDIEVVEREIPKLEASQDLELLAQEIAEAVVEDERRTSSTPSPTPTPTPTLTSAKTSPEDKEVDKEGPDTQEDTAEGLRSGSPVDEASWVMVEAEEEYEMTPGPEGQTKTPQQRFSVFRKFLARGDLRQKLADLGLVSEGTQDQDSSHQEVESLRDMTGSCSESMVICDLPQEEGEEEGTSQEEEPVFLKDPPEAPPLPGWRGTFSGATVAVSIERQGGLLVAGVRLWHVDLLSALTSLRQLVSSAGLISYADIDVPSLLARAA